MDHEQAIEKYEKRGWEIQKNITEQEQEDINSSFRVEDRWIGDEKTWFLPFDTEASKRDALAAACATGGVDPIRLNSFSLARNPLRTVCELKFAVLRPVFFKNHCTVSFNLARKLEIFFDIITMCDFNCCLEKP